MFSEYYEKYIGYNNAIKENDCYICISDMRDLTLNKRFIYRIIITTYNNHKVISVSPSLNNEVRKALSKFISGKNVEDALGCAPLINTGLRIGLMYRMILNEIPIVDICNSDISYNDILKKFCFKVENKVVCYCKISDIIHGYGNIVVWTDENYRGRGLAKQLLLLTIKKCIEDGIDPIYLVNSENIPSISLAKSVGFEIIQTEVIACEEITIS